MLNVRALAVALAILWGGAMMFLAGMASFGWGGAWVTAIGDLYIGYQPGFLGGLIGAAWGAIDAGIGGLIFGWLYNWLSIHL
ncbi:MAG: bacteriophage holin [Gammaproteobacteria bacterium]|jgi:hypothetical protein|nr:bacteriophage holin [Gammaproteobacteria bacterium]MBT3488235.1 bacteriophage holin [Gammaproteobacteria bacterium]MBT3718998.1 bacteriophage holin [Gammaproteobacteria bacterium]MBT3843852.1 bacteriophage holin [Gammaproteobacteria bacterium]MBT3892414.1 bacteriophage holin [Gammaproteobacteria bacterium]